MLGRPINPVIHQTFLYCFFRYLNCAWCWGHKEKQYSVPFLEELSYQETHGIQYNSHSTRRLTKGYSSREEELRNSVSERKAREAIQRWRSGWGFNTYEFSRLGQGESVPGEGNTMGKIWETGDSRLRWGEALCTWTFLGKRDEQGGARSVKVPHAVSGSLVQPHLPQSSHL